MILAILAHFFFHVNFRISLCLKKKVQRCLWKSCPSLGSGSQGVKIANVLFPALYLHLSEVSSCFGWGHTTWKGTSPNPNVPWRDLVNIWSSRGNPSRLPEIREGIWVHSRTKWKSQFSLRLLWVLTGPSSMTNVANHCEIHCQGQS